MTGILLVAHGGFADGILSSLSLIMGDPKYCSTVSLLHGDDPEDFYDRVSAEADVLDAAVGEMGVLILADLFGGTPATCAARLVHVRGARKVRCVTGLNLPMLVEAVSDRDELGLAELERACVRAGKQGVVDVAERLSV